MLSDDEFEYFCVDNVLSYILFSAISTKTNFVTYSVQKYKMCKGKKLNYYKIHQRGIFRPRVK